MAMSADIKEIHQEFLNSEGICTDTRQLAPNCFFVALKGDNFDGNAFVLAALKAGAKTILMEEKTPYNDASLAPYSAQIFFADDTLEALQDLARFHRKYLNLPLIALTGSNGKTTTKELLHATLSQEFNCMATLGNLNNHIGVPLTLLGMNKETDVGIVEMGANHQGEIAALCQIAMPNFGYITNFGKAHLEGFGGEEGVIKGKSELIDYLGQTGGHMFVQATDHRQMERTKGMERTILNKEDHWQVLQNIQSENPSLKPKKAVPTLTLNSEKGSVHTQLIGDYNLPNVIAAAEIGTYFGVSWDEIKKALESYVPKMNRSQGLKRGNHDLIMDAYNANPSSVRAALIHFDQTHCEGNKTIILGDMFELGPKALEEHQRIVDLAKQLSFDEIYLTGSLFHQTQHESPHIHSFEHFKALENDLLESPPKLGSVLIKGSRGMALERLLDSVFKA
jgi:UDP-N-acetylmuramoyl-tripeptide--D-alanyl-D-alanine ligase